VEQFVAWLRIQKNRPLTTVRAYRQDLAKFVAYMRSTGAADAALCAAIDRDSLRRYQIQLADILAHPRTRARALVALRQFLSYAHDQQWIDADMTKLVVVPRFVAGDPHPIPSALVGKLLAALPRANLRDLRDRALVHFLLASGCRISEALALDSTDLRPDGMRVLGKGGKYRTVYLTNAAHEAVRDYLRMRGPDDSPALFISVANGDMSKHRALPHNRLTTDGARHALASLRRRMSIDHDISSIMQRLRSPHVARHTAATSLLEATDGDVRLVQEVLGHATLETLRVYTEITDTRKRSAYARLGDYIEEVSE
jgi:site-specific recombinase XerD